MFEGPGYRHSQLVDAQSGRVLVEDLVIARGAKARQRGLLGLDGLPDGCGLLIGEPLIHMSGMRFALDLVFLSRQGEVLKVYADVNPGLRMRGCLRARRCLELPAGDAARVGIRRGMTVEFS